MKAAHGIVADVRKVPSQSVCKATIEFPIEAYVQLVAMLDSQKVLITISTLDIPYGIVDGGQEAIKDGETTTDDGRGEKTPVGPLCKWVVMRCKEPAFQEFVRKLHYGECLGVASEASAKNVIYDICGIQSRKEIDADPVAARHFRQAIMIPWSNHPSNPHRGLVDG